MADAEEEGEYEEGDDGGEDAAAGSKAAAVAAATAGSALPYPSPSSSSAATGPAATAGGSGDARAQLLAVGAVVYAPVVRGDTRTYERATVQHYDAASKGVDVLFTPEAEAAQRTASFRTSDILSDKEPLLRDVSETHLSLFALLFFSFVVCVREMARLLLAFLHFRFSAPPHFSLTQNAVLPLSQFSFLFVFFHS